MLLHLEHKRQNNTVINSVAITLKKDCIYLFVVAIEPFYIAKILVDHRKLLNMRL